MSLSLYLSVCFNLQPLAQLANSLLVQTVHYRHSTIVHVVQVLQDRNTRSSTENTEEEKLKPLAQSWKCMEEV